MVLCTEWREESSINEQSQLNNDEVLEKKIDSPEHCIGEKLSRYTILSRVWAGSKQHPVLKLWE